MHSLLVSIVIPCHNSTKYLEQAVASCLKQSYSNFEILLIENGSSDDTWAMCQDLASKHSQIRALQSEPSKRVGGARNLGISEAKGHYILFVDDDDEITPNALRDLVDNSLEGMADIVVGKRQHVLLNGSIYYTSYESKGIFASMLFSDKKTVFNGTPAKLHKKAFLIDNNILFPENIVYSEDFYFTTLTLIFAKTTVVLPAFYDAIYIYYVREDSSITNWASNFDFFISNLITSTTLTLDVWQKIASDDTKLAQILGNQYLNYKEHYLPLANKTMQAKFKHNINYVFNNQISDEHKDLYIKKLKEAGIIDRVNALYQEKKTSEPFLPILNKKHVIHLIKSIIKSFVPNSISKKLAKKANLF